MECARRRRLSRGRRRHRLAVRRRVQSRRAPVRFALPVGGPESRGGPATGVGHRFGPGGCRLAGGPWRTVHVRQGATGAFPSRSPRTATVAMTAGARSIPPAGGQARWSGQSGDRGWSPFRPRRGSTGRQPVAHCACTAGRHWRLPVPVAACGDGRDDCGRPFDSPRRWTCPESRGCPVCDGGVPEVRGGGGGNRTPVPRCCCWGFYACVRITSRALRPGGLTPSRPGTRDAARAAPEPSGMISPAARRRRRASPLRCVPSPATGRTWEGRSQS
ncbi:MAG: hypothetical protein HMLKMBBP_00885 [Planctomycetes bacterium]|nr:hypothetical protein [Planctomycetota bacterium]